MRRARVKAPRIRVDSSDGHGVHAVQIQDPGPPTCSLPSCTDLLLISGSSLRCTCGWGTSNPFPVRQR